MKEQKSALLNLLDSLLQQDECEFLDFKQEFHANNVDLIHDILCLANAYTNSKFECRVWIYIIVGRTHRFAPTEI
jgi:hypothetical protein